MVDFVAADTVAVIVVVIEPLCSEPAPKSIPCRIVLPRPLKFLGFGLSLCCWSLRSLLGKLGLAAVVALLEGDLEDDQDI